MELECNSKLESLRSSLTSKYENDIEVLKQNRDNDIDKLNACIINII